MQKLTPLESESAFSYMQKFNTVNRHNLETLSLTIKHLIKKASYIALDTEFTGLGDPKTTRTTNIDDRYRVLSQVASTHAIVAFGMSIFEQKDQGYQVHNFHFVMLCTLNHTISPASLSFLASHGFDFNDQILNGIPYRPGNDVLLLT